jgi:uncharacterized protein YgiB involved in biofilm formation
MKRSRSIALTTIMTSTGLSLAACDSPPPTNATWLNPPPAESSAAQALNGRTYPTLQACREANAVPDSECDNAFSQAQAQAPRFGDRQSCEERYGVDQCVPRSQAGGGGFFMPLLTGFVVGQALNNLGDRGYYGMQYPGRYGGGYLGGYGGGRDYVTGRSYGSYEAPARVQSRSAVISRGGFGGGGGHGFGG